MADFVPTFPAGAAFTLKASADVIGGRVVVVSGAGTVAHAGVDAAHPAGVAGQDAKTGEDVLVYPISGVHSLVAGAAVAAGAPVATLAAGKVDDTGTNVFGVALDAAAAADAVIRVLVK